MHAKQGSTRRLVPAYVAGLLLVAVVSAQEYQITDLGATGDNGNMAWSLNQRGDVCGWSDFIDSGSEGYLYSEGRVRYVGLGSAGWINNAGQIVGYASADPNSNQTYGVIWEDEQIFRLPPLNGRNHLPIHIHDNGDVAGFARLSEFEGRPRAVLWRDRKIVLQLGTLADDTPFEPIASSSAHGVNADGVIVGMSTPATGDGSVPFMYRDGEMIQLDDLMPAPWEAYRVGPGAINDAGQIAVQAGIPGSGSRALLLTPRVVGDVNGDGCVDFADVLLILAAWDNAGGPEDLDGSGFVGFEDLLILLAAWEPCG